MFLGIFGGLTEHGGVERANRLTAAVLTQMALERKQPCCILSLNDAPGVRSVEVDGLTLAYTGFARNKSKLIGHAISLALRTRTVFIGHPNIAPIGSLLRGLNPRLRYWVASHGVEVWQPIRGFRRVALRHAEAVTAPSRYTADHLIKTQRIDPVKVRLLPYCLDPAFENGDAGRPHKSASGSPRILTVARLLVSEPGKGVDTVIQALPQVLEALPDTRYVIVGDGDDRQRLEGLANELGVADRVSFLGHLSEEALRECYSTSDIFAMPSRQEGFGIAFLEAMGFGKPVVAADFGGARDIVIDGETGFLVPYGEISTVAQRLIALLDDADLRIKMGHCGIERVQKNYTFTHFRRTLTALLDGSLNMN